MNSPPDDVDDTAPPGERWADDAVSIDRARECFSFLRGVPILYEIDDTTLWSIARCADETEFEAGKVVVAQGSSPDEERERRFYVIRSGSADVMRNRTTDNDQPVARLSVGSYFGELGLLTNQTRNATVRVHGPAPLRVYAFDALTFHRLIAEHVLVFRVLRERQKLQRTGDGTTRMQLRELDLLRGMPEADLDFVLRHAEHRWHPANTPIITQGDAGDRFFILLDGSVDIVRDDECVATLHPGEFFGETALLLDTPRTATVRAVSHTLTWSITRSAFQRLVGHYLLANPTTQATIMNRMSSSVPDFGS